VSAAILCLVNFVYHSRDQKRIHALRSVLTKNRAKIAGAESKAAIAQSIAEQANTQAEQQQRRAEEAERKLEELRVIAESAQDEAMQAWTAAQTAQQTAQQAQQIAEREKRWRANRALLLGRWQCVEYSALPRSTDADRAREIHQELDRDRDILFFGADDRFMLFHPGRSSTWMARITTAFRDENTHERDVPFEKGGRWSLAETGDAVVIEYADGTSETMKVKTLTKTRLTVDKSSEEWDLLRTLVKIG
jgi:flagellar biosynthesis GTPase FlhF